MGHEVFIAKLDELKRQQEELMDCLSRFQSADTADIDDYLRQLNDEYQENTELLKSCIREGRSPAIVALSEAQLAYYNHMRDILKDRLPAYMDSGDRNQDQAEAAALYAEYAIDFASQAIRHALMVSLKAIELQNNSTPSTQIIILGENIYE